MKNKSLSCPAGQILQILNLVKWSVVVCASWVFLLACLLLSFLQDSDGLVSKWYFCGCTIFCNLSSVIIRLRWSLLIYGVVTILLIYLVGFIVRYIQYISSVIIRLSWIHCQVDRLTSNYVIYFYLFYYGDVQVPGLLSFLSLLHHQFLVLDKHTFRY